MPRNPLQLVSLISISSLVPARTAGSELTSSFAASMATLATLPMVESIVRRAPTCTTEGLGEGPCAARMVLEKMHKRSGSKASITVIFPVTLRSRWAKLRQIEGNPIKQNKNKTKILSRKKEPASGRETAHWFLLSLGLQAITDRPPTSISQLSS